MESLDVPRVRLAAIHPLSQPFRRRLVSPWYPRAALRLGPFRSST
jgi:hypothetical protein